MAETPIPYSVQTFTASDGYRWSYRCFSSPAEPKAHVVCLHGIQSHGGWYEYSCGRLAQAGFAVTFLDRRGSGLNEQDRGDTPNFRRPIDDIAEFLTPRRLQPTFLVAISWGGKLAVALQRRHPGLVDGLALLAPGFCPRVGPSPRERLRIVWARMTHPKRLFPIPLADPELFTANPERQRYIRDDPLSLRQATARFLVESVRLDAYLRRAPKRVTVPVLLMLAGRDRILDNLRTRRFVERFAASDKTILEYPEAQHTLEFEPDPERFVCDLQTWLEQRAARR